MKSLVCFHPGFSASRCDSLPFPRVNLCLRPNGLNTFLSCKRNLFCTQKELFELEQELGEDWIPWIRSSLKGGWQSQCGPVGATAAELRELPLFWIIYWSRNLQGKRHFQCPKKKRKAKTLNSIFFQGIERDAPGQVKVYLRKFFKQEPLGSSRSGPWRATQISFFNRFFSFGLFSTKMICEPVLSEKSTKGNHVSLQCPQRS